MNAEQFDSATVFFSDIADFHEISVNSFPIDIIDFLNELYNFMDKEIVKYDVYKVRRSSTSVAVLKLYVPRGLVFLLSIIIVVVVVIRVEGLARWCRADVQLSDTILSFCHTIFLHRLSVFFMAFLFCTIIYHSLR